LGSFSVDSKYAVAAQRAVTSVYDRISSKTSGVADEIIGREEQLRAAIFELRCRYFNSMSETNEVDKLGQAGLEHLEQVSPGQKGR
jgi:hypothetical protein